MCGTSDTSLSEEILTPREAAAAGVDAWAVLPSARIPFSPEIRQICRENTCRGYGRTWACPPAWGSYEDGVQLCLSYSRILVFSTAYPIRDSFDLEGMHRAMGQFKDVCDRVHRYAAQKRQRFLVLSNESCFRCERCTYPQAPCRFPDLLHPSIEGFGILVGELAARAGLSYAGGGDSVRYFGGVLY